MLCRQLNRSVAHAVHSRPIHRGVRLRESRYHNRHRTCYHTLLRALSWCEASAAHGPPHCCILSRLLTAACRLATTAAMHGTNPQLTGVSEGTMCSFAGGTDVGHTAVARKKYARAESGAGLLVWVEGAPTRNRRDCCRVVSGDTGILPRFRLQYDAVPVQVFVACMI